MKLNKRVRRQIEEWMNHRAFGAEVAAYKQVTAFYELIGDDDFYRFRDRAARILQRGRADNLLDAFALAKFVENYL